MPETIYLEVFDPFTGDHYHQCIDDKNKEAECEYGKRQRNQYQQRAEKDIQQTKHDREDNSSAITFNMHARQYLWQDIGNCCDDE